MASPPTRESTSSSTRSLFSPQPRSASVADVAPSVFSTATGSARTPHTNTLRSFLLIQCTRLSDVTQTPNGLPSRSTSIASAVDLPQQARKAVVLARDICTSRPPVAPGGPHGNAETSFVSGDTVRNPSLFETHSQTYPYISHTLASNPSLCHDNQVTGNLPNRPEILCAVLVVSTTFVSGLADTLPVLLQLFVGMVQITGLFSRTS